MYCLKPISLFSCWLEPTIPSCILRKITIDVYKRQAKDKACLTNLMNNLEKKGYVYRKEDPADRRNKLVFLTPEGEEFKDQVIWLSMAGMPAIL